MKILVVDDEPDLLDAMELCWADEVDLTFAKRGDEALEEVDKDLPDVMLTDFRMPGMDGIELMNKVKTEHPSILTVLMTAYPDPSLVDQARAVGCDKFLPKPFDPKATLEQIRTLMQAD